MSRNELPIPPSAASDPNGIELLRVWAAHGKQHISLATDIWDDPAAWGIMLVDLAKHIAAAYQETAAREIAGTLERIKQGMNAEWQSATDQPSGTVLEEWSGDT